MTHFSEDERQSNLCKANPRHGKALVSEVDDGVFMVEDFCAHCSAQVLVSEAAYFLAAQ